jgi:hypothetical protein
MRTNFGSNVSVLANSKVFPKSKGNFDRSTFGGRRQNINLNHSFAISSLDRTNLGSEVGLPGLDVGITKNSLITRILARKHAASEIEVRKKRHVQGFSDSIDFISINCETVMKSFIFEKCTAEPVDEERLRQ